MTSPDAGVPLASPVLTRRATVALMLAMGVAATAGLLAWGPVGVSAGMHRFADARTVWGVPYGGNVWSHLPLLPIGAWGLWRVSRLPSAEPLRWIWAWFFCCQMLATVGGMVYHWVPHDASFVWDQVPRSAACALFSAAFLAERIDRRFGHPRAIAAALTAALLGGGWWLLSLHLWGEGDLRPLIWLEFSPIALVMAGAWSLHGHLLSRQDWLRSQISFVVAQTIDWADRPIFAWTGETIGGHALRHLALAACVGWVAYRLGSVRPVMANVSSPRGTAPASWLRPIRQAKVTSFPDKRLAS